MDNDKLRMRTPDLMEENFKKLQELFPNAVTETLDADGNVRRAVDADVLRQEIDAAVVEMRDERYKFRVYGVEQGAMSLSVTQVDSVAQSLSERFVRLSRAPHIAHDTRERSLKGYLFHQYTDLLNLQPTLLALLPAPKMIYPRLWLAQRLGAQLRTPN